MGMGEMLRGLLRSRETVVMPDAYDAISARVIERAGFPAVQCSGGSMAIARCLAAETELSLEENLEATRRIVGAVSVPVMADGEDGYGDAAATAETVRRFAEVGAAGVNIEDSVPGERRLVDVSVMLEKIAAAREAGAGMVVNARTDALRAFGSREEGVREAVRRANLYLAAGADLAFLCFTATLDEVRTFAAEVDGPISIAAGMPYNIREFTVEDLRRLGVARVSLPMLAILSSVRALVQAVGLVNEPDGFARIADEGLFVSQEELGRIR